jgi:hypothetical protein
MDHEQISEEEIRDKLEVNENCITKLLNELIICFEKNKELREELIEILDNKEK